MNSKEKFGGWLTKLERYSPSSLGDTKHVCYFLVPVFPKVQHYNDSFSARVHIIRFLSFSGFQRPTETTVSRHIRTLSGKHVRFRSKLIPQLSRNPLASRAHLVKFPTFCDIGNQNRPPQLAYCRFKLICSVFDQNSVFKIKHKKSKNTFHLRGMSKSESHENPPETPKSPHLEHSRLYPKTEPLPIVRDQSRGGLLRFTKSIAFPMYHEIDTPSKKPLDLV